MSILSTMHEIGHGMYEHAMSVEHVGTPLGSPASFSIHEAQSRLWENHIGRSLPFWQWLQPQLQNEYGVTATPEALYTAINKSEPGFIRVDADELTYTLHIIARFELEQSLMSGELAVADLPAAWNEKYQSLLGITPPTDALGVLQDVHWSGGAFGYFPAYALGNMIATQQWAAMRKDLPVDDLMRRGNFIPLKNWLYEHIQQHGQRYETKDLVLVGTGKELSTADYLSYLTEKFKQR